MEKFIKVNTITKDKYVPKSLNYLTGEDRSKVAKRIKLINPAIINVEDISAIIPYSYTYDSETLENTVINAFQIILKNSNPDIAEIIINEKEYEKINKELFKKYGHNEKI